VVGPVTARAAFALAYLVVFGSVVGFAAYFYLLRHWDATTVSTSTYVNPVVAVILGALILGEPVTAPMVIGTVVILVGVTLVLREQAAARS
ncbi:MAG TPA: EamA family transporter, partial [Dongiaceae bacterium]|nr:EamA family transporter [Dongiaceae bacterium]